MLKSLVFFIRFFTFWLALSFVARLTFIGVNLENINQAKFQEIIAAFYHGLRLDLAAIGYLAILPLLYFTIIFLSSKKVIAFGWLTVYNIVLIIIFGLIETVNINIYREWGSKINSKALGFAFTAPNEALASSASSPIVMNLLILGLLIGTGLVLNKWINRRQIATNPSSIAAKLVFIVFILGLNFLMIRGGWGVSPNNQSMAYYSDKQILNHAAVNTEWNLIADLLESRHVDKNPYLYYTADAAKRQTAELYRVKKDTTIHILNSTRPNIVVIIMESFTADLTKTLGDENDITPKFDSLVKQGVLFSHIYSTGNRTDKGIIGTLAGQPSLAAGNILKWPGKMEKIPALSREFLKSGYQTSFFYGGQSEFQNYKAFILSHGYQSLVDKTKFKAADMNSKWGAYDGVVFNRALQDLNKTRQPFFATQLTLTNHEPFEVPGAYKFGKNNNVQKFKSTAYYTDSCLSDFLMRAKKQAWYKNTLFILIADHGHIMPKGREEIYIPQRYHVPLLFFGEVIKNKYRGKIMSQTGSQIDLASTLLHQLNMDAKAFKWSKNLLNPETKPFAYFSWDNGMGFIDNKQCVTFDNVGRMNLYNDHPVDARNTARLLRNAKSYLQTTYQDFLSL